MKSACWLILGLSGIVVGLGLCGFHARSAASSSLPIPRSPSVCKTAEERLLRQAILRQQQCRPRHWRECVLAR